MLRAEEGECRLLCQHLLLQTCSAIRKYTNLCLALLSTSGTVQDPAHIFPQPEISKQLSSPQDQRCAVSLFDPVQICAFYADKSGFVHEGAA